MSCLTVESCDYSVMEGVVDVTLADGTVVTVTAPATLDVTNGVATGPVPLSWDGLFGDPWLVANTDRDVEAGFADRATVYSGLRPRLRLNGRRLHRHRHVDERDVHLVLHRSQRVAC